MAVTSNGRHFIFERKKEMTYARHNRHPEQPVQIAIVSWLRMNGFKVFSPDAGINVKSKMLQSLYKRMGRSAGIPDLIVLIPNGTIGIEVKRPKTLKYSLKTGRMVINDAGGRLSDAQKKYADDIKEIPGHHYIVASDVQQVVDYIKGLKIDPKMTNV